MWYQLLTIESCEMNGCHQNENLYDPSLSITMFEVKICVFVRNKSIIKMFLTSNRCIWIKTSIYNIAFSSGKSHFVWIRSDISTDQAPFPWEKFMRIIRVVWIIMMFLSAVWTHSDGTHYLQMICWLSKWCTVKFVLLKKQTHLYLGRPESGFSADFNF